MDSLRPFVAVLFLAVLCTAGVFFYWSVVKGPGGEGTVAPASAPAAPAQSGSPTSAPAVARGP